MPYCNKCGARVDEDDVFCRKCGAPVKGDQGTEGMTSVEAGVKSEGIRDMKVVALVCPQCGGKINLPPDKDGCTCPFCGAEVVLDRGNRTVTYRTEDVARVRQIEANREQDRASRVTRRVLLGALLVAIVIAIIMGYNAAETDNDNLALLAFLIGAMAFFIATAWWVTADAKETERNKTPEQRRWENEQNERYIAREQERLDRLLERHLNRHQR